MSQAIKIVILGGGYAGVALAKKLEKQYRGNKAVELLLIDKVAYHTMRTVLHEVAVGAMDESIAKMDLSDLFKGKDIKIIEEEIQSIDSLKKKLYGKEINYDYDYLVVATGSQIDTFGIKGAKEFARSIWTLDDAMDLKVYIEKNHKLGDPFVVIGAGFTGIELAGELAGNYKESTVYLVNSKEEVLMNYPKKLSDKASKQLLRMGVEVLNNVRVSEIDNEKVLLSNGRLVESKTIVWTAGIRSAGITDSLDLQKNNRSQLLAKDTLQSLDDESIFIIGDTISFLTSDGKPLPQMVENAKASADLVAGNIHRHINSKELRRYKPVLHGSVVSIGLSYGIANLSVAGVKIALSGVIGATMKHMIHGFYYFSVMGGSKAWIYLKNEMNCMRHK